MDILSNAFVGSHMERTSRDPHGICAAYEFGLAKAIFEKLWEHYPGYDWKVRVDAQNGYAQVQLPRVVNRASFGYIIKLDQLAGDLGMKIAMRGAGEFLERFKLRRGRVNKAEYVDVLRARGRVHGHRDDIPGGYKGESPKPRLIIPSELAFAGSAAA